MLWKFAVMLIIFWLLALMAGTTMGGFVHVLLVSAVVMLVIGIIRGRKLGYQANHPAHLMTENQNIISSSRTSRPLPPRRTG